MDDLFDLLHRFKSAFEKKPQNEPVSDFPPSGAEGKFFRLWNWILPLLLGLTAGWFAMICLEIWLEGRNLHSRPAVVASSFAFHAQAPETDKIAVFLRTNPFGVTPMPVPDIEPYIPPPPIVSSMESVVLTGTSPGHMAWMRYQERLRLILIGNQFYSYTLVEVTYLDATFINGENLVKHLIFGNRQVAPSQRLPRATPPGEGMIFDHIAGATGQISRELVNQMLENPFDELRKIRFRPASAGYGLQVEWITDYSVLAQLGVQEGDVIRAINGIVFHNAMDVVNSLHSLMESDQFVIEVTRSGAPALLQYVVR